MRLFIMFLVLLSSLKLNASEINSSIGHFYWGLSQNFGLLGNVRLGAGSVELGIIQGVAGVALVHRTSSNIFYQLGVTATTPGIGVIGGGGLEWDTSSFFRFRTDITVRTDVGFQTESFVSVGGVFIL